MNTEQPIYQKLQLKQYQDLFSRGKALSTDVDGNIIEIDIAASTPSGKIPKSALGSDMPGDNVYIYTILASDILALGQSISVIGFLVNNKKFYPDEIFSGNQGSLSAGDTISFSGLPAKADITKLNFNLI